jgi:hypothetical protein
MKIKTILLTGAIALATSVAGFAQTVYNLTGATAFRAASNNTILQLLGGQGVVEYAYSGNQALSGANRAIFHGTFNGSPVIVRTSWSGSTQGIKDLADQTAIQFLDLSNPVSTAGTNLSNATFTTAVARWSFSDVDKLLSERPNAPLAGGPVGVVPFMFVAGEGSPAGMTNMTDQLHNALWSAGLIDSSFFGAAAGTTVLATGRNNGSGTRATILAETGYGAFTTLVQYEAAISGNRTDATGQLGAITSFANGGFSSNSGVRDVLTRDPSTMTFDGSPVDAVFCSYLTISDALDATGYVPDSNTIVGGEGAIPMTYNGVRYTVEFVKNGAYTLWGYQQLYLANGATQAEQAFDAALRAAIPTSMGTAGIPIPDMNVTRFGGDGGIVLPND